MPRMLSEKVRARQKVAVGVAGSLALGTLPLAALLGKLQQTRELKALPVRAEAAFDGLCDRHETY